MELKDLTQKKCRPCEGGTSPLSEGQAKTFLRELKGWKLVDNRKIEKEFAFKDFVSNIRFVNEIARLAEKEGHHPDLSIHYNKLTVQLWTHAIGGLSENDFIVAAKIEAL